MPARMGSVAALVRRPGAAPAATFAAATLAIQHPTPASLTDTLPGGLSDPGLHVWSLAWGAHALLRDPLGVFDGPTYWPASRALAYSDPLLPLAPLELPMVDPRRGSDWNVVEGTRMLLSTIDLRPRVNGFSGYHPARYLDDLEAINGFPGPAGVDRLESLGVRYVVLHLGEEQGVPAFGDDAAQAVLDDLPPIVDASRHGAAWLVDLGAQP